jgi:hypothetical protein
VAVYQRIFVSRDAAQVHRLFLEVTREARQLDLLARRAGIPGGARAALVEIEAAYRRYNEELRGLAQTTARDSERRMRAKVTHVRPSTRLGNTHLKALLKSRPIRLVPGIESGAVGIADEAWLNKAVNPTSPQYGPYWRAQEYGTGSPEVPSQIGRTIVGYFYGPGLTNPTRPDPQFAGGGGPHPIFVSAKSAAAIAGGSGFHDYGGGRRGGKGGRGIIGKEIEGKHFIRDGANEALAEWRLGMRRIEQSTIARLQSVVSPRTPGRRLSTRRRR